MVDFLKPLKYNIIVRQEAQRNEVFTIAKKMGRPKADKPKGIQYSVRLDEELETRVERYCEQNNITKAQAFRKGIRLLVEEAENQDRTGGCTACRK